MSNRAGILLKELRRKAGLSAKGFELKYWVKNFKWTAANLQNREAGKVPLRDSEVDELIELKFIQKDSEEEKKLREAIRLDRLDKAAGKPDEEKLSKSELSELKHRDMVALVELHLENRALKLALEDLKTEYGLFWKEMEERADKSEMASVLRWLLTHMQYDDWQELKVKIPEVVAAFKKANFYEERPLIYHRLPTDMQTAVMLDIIALMVSLQGHHNPLEEMSWGGTWGHMNWDFNQTVSLLEWIHGLLLEEETKGNLSREYSIDDRIKWEEEVTKRATDKDNTGTVNRSESGGKEGEG